MAKESFYEQMKRLGLWDKPIGELANVIDEKDKVIAEKDKEIERLKSLVDGAMEIVEISGKTDAQINWREAWLKNAREILKEDSDEC